MARRSGKMWAWAAILLSFVTTWSAPLTPAAQALQFSQVRQDRLAEARRRAQARRAIVRLRLANWREAIAERRRAHPERFERSRLGEWVTRGRVIAIDPSPEAALAAQRLGFRRLRETSLGELGLRMVVLRAPRSMSAVAALEALRAADPQGAYELNHVFDPSQGASTPSSAALPTPAPGARQHARASGVRIGMIDGGVGADHPALAQARIHARAFVETPAPSPHGTAVASLLVGEDGSFRGAAPGADLYAADVFGADIDGGSATAIAEAIGWLTSQGVRVINLSLEGPPNRLVEAVCRSAQARGVILVAAVGNAGPTAPVAYPAAYPGVVAVTAVDEADRVYLLANRGPQVAFATRGVDITAATDGDAYEVVSGTSFAAPQIAAALALLGAASAQDAVNTLAGQAVDLGAPGRDAVYGFGRPS